MQILPSPSTTLMGSVLRVAKIVGLITLIFIVADFVFEDWKWGLFDFAIAAVLLFVAGFGIDLAMTKLSNQTLKVAIISGIILTFVLIWAELAVDLLSNDARKFLLF